MVRRFLRTNKAEDFAATVQLALERVVVREASRALKRSEGIVLTEGVAAIPVPIPNSTPTPIPVPVCTALLKCPSEEPFQQVQVAGG